MIILNNDYKIKNVEALQVYEESKPIIWRFLQGQMYNYSSHADDIFQECALVFFGNVVAKYDYTKGIIIGQYLKICYQNAIYKYLKKENKNIFHDDVDDKIVALKVEAVDLHNWQIENMEFSKLLTKEQKQILQLILSGYDYSDICDIVCPENKTQDKKRPIYRRMCRIKEIISKFYGINYQAIDHSGNIKKSELAYLKHLRSN